METEVLATLLGVALAALVAACGAGFRWMRSDFKRLEDRFDRLEAKVDRLEAKVDRLEAKVDRLEAKVDNLIVALTYSGVLIDPQTADSGAAPPTAGAPSIAQQPSRAPPAEPSGPTVQPV